MTPEQFASYVLSSSPRVPRIILGPPGFAKSATCKLVHTMLEEREGRPLPYEVFDLATKLPEDLTGLPYNKDGITHYAPMAGLAKFLEPGTKGVLVLDDLPAADMSVQTVAFGLLGPDRTVGGHKVSDDTYILVTGNRREDKAAAVQLPSPVLNRCEVRDDVLPDVKGWSAWALAHGAHPLVTGFIAFKQLTGLSQHPTDADDMGRFGSPRAWFNLGLNVPAAQEHNCLRQVSQAFVGEGLGIEFAAFVAVRDECDPGQILDGVLVPENLRGPGKDPGKAASLATAIAEETVARIDRAPALRAKTIAEDEVLKCLKALGTHFDPEFGAAGLRQLLQLYGDSVEVIYGLDVQGRLLGKARDIYQSVCESVTL